MKILLKLLCLSLLHVTLGQHAFDNCVKRCSLSAIATQSTAELCADNVESVCSAARSTCKTGCSSGRGACRRVEDVCKAGCSACVWCSKKKKRRCRRKCENAKDRCMSPFNSCESACDRVYNSCVRDGPSACWSVHEKSVTTCWSRCDPVAQEPNNDEKRRLRAQHHLDDQCPLFEATFIGTHNSYNTMDDLYPAPNHALGIKEQLDLGIRLINYDLHSRGGEVIMCHDGFGDGLLCSDHDRKWKDSLAHVKEWLNHSNNRDEFIMIILEDYVGAGRHKAVEAIQAELGNLLFSPVSYDSSTTGNSCTELPIDDSSVTKALIKASGKRVLIADAEESCKNTSAAWRKLVWKIPTKGYDDGEDIPSNKDFMSSTKLKMIYEDLAVIGSVLDSKFISGSEASRATRRGVNLVGLDFAGKIDRIGNLIWSWASQEPKTNSCGSNCCAILQTNTKWKLGPCSSTLHHACRNEVTGEWKVSPSKGTFDSDRCSELGSDYVFAAPTNGNYNNQLHSARNSANLGNQLVFVNHRH